MNPFLFLHLRHDSPLSLLHPQPFPPWWFFPVVALKPCHLLHAPLKPPYYLTLLLSTKVLQLLFNDHPTGSATSWLPSSAMSLSSLWHRLPTLFLLKQSGPVLHEATLSWFPPTFLNSFSVCFVSAEG